MQRSTFTTLALAATSMLGLVSAQMDIDCFVVSDLKGGSDYKKDFHHSDLPKLMANFQPEQRLEKIKIWTSEKPMSTQGYYNDMLDGFQFQLTNNKYDLEKYGTSPESSSFYEFDINADKVDEIEFLYNQDGLCNIKLIEVGQSDVYEAMEDEFARDDDEDWYDLDDDDDDWYDDDDDWFDDDEPIYDFDWIQEWDLEDRLEDDFSKDEDDYYPYVVKNDFCTEGAPGVEVVSVELDDILPVVGFHARKKQYGQGLSSFGFIWYNVEDDTCRTTIKMTEARKQDVLALSADELDELFSKKQKMENKEFSEMLIQTSQDMEASMFDDLFDDFQMQKDIQFQREDHLDDLMNAYTKVKDTNWDTDYNEDLTEDIDDLYDMIDELLDYEDVAEMKASKMQQNNDEFMREWGDFKIKFSEEQRQQNKIKEMVMDIADIEEADSDDTYDMLVEILDALDAYGDDAFERAEENKLLFSEKSESTLTVEKFDEEINKILIICIFVTVFGIAVGCIGFYVIQKCLAGRYAAKAPTTIPKETFHAVDVVSARGPRQATVENEDIGVQKKDLEGFDDPKSTQ